MKSVKIVILVVILTLITVPAFAQRQMQGAPGDGRFQQRGEFSPADGPGSPASEERREEIRKKIETIRIWRMTEELKLDSGTSAKLASLLSPIEQKRRELFREQVGTMGTLRRTLAAQKPDEEKIKHLLDKLENSHNSIQALRNEEVEGLKQILTVEQQARFLIFQHEFEREMREMIAEARGGMRRSGIGGNAREPGQRDFRGPGGPRTGQGEPDRAPRY